MSLCPFTRTLAVAVSGVVLSLPAQGPLRAQSPADSAAVRAAALDYIEGWYQGDAERMEQAIHPQLAKRLMVRDPAEGGPRLLITSALELVQQVRRGGGTTTPEADRRTGVTILDVFEGAASVRVDAHGWIDYMHLSESAGEWRIVNVLWEVRPSREGRIP